MPEAWLVCSLGGRLLGKDGLWILNALPFVGLDKAPNLPIYLSI